MYLGNNRGLKTILKVDGFYKRDFFSFFFKPSRIELNVVICLGNPK